MGFKDWLAVGFIVIVTAIVLYQVWTRSEHLKSENSSMLTHPRRSKIIIVNYYASWCPASNEFLPVWERFIEELRIKYPEIDTRNVICEGSNERKCAFKGINGYPSVIMYKGREEISFDGGRTLLNLHKFVEDNL